MDCRPLFSGRLYSWNRIMEPSAPPLLPWVTSHSPASWKPSRMAARALSLQPPKRAVRSEETLNQMLQAAPPLTPLPTVIPPSSPPPPPPPPWLAGTGVGTARRSRSCTSSGSRIRSAIARPTGVVIPSCKSPMGTRLIGWDARFA